MSALRGLIAALAISPWLLATPVAAQSSRTYVSGLGNDSGSCSRNAPCLTLQRAFNQTRPGGQIYALNSADYGSVTIDKAISIISGRGATGVLAQANVGGITINAGANDAVTLQGLNIDGAGSGSNGVLFTSGASLHIQDSVIRGFTIGINFQASGASTLLVEKTTVTNNGTGINFQTSVTTTGVLNDLQAINNASGITAAGTSSSAVANLTVQGSMIANNSTAGVLAGRFSAAAVSNTTLANNGVALQAESPTAKLQVFGSTVTGNGTGWATSNGGQVISSGGNSFGGNAAGDTAPPTIVQPVAVNGVCGSANGTSVFSCADNQSVQHRLCLQRLWQRAVRMELHRLQRRQHRELFRQQDPHCRQRRVRQRAGDQRLLGADNQSLHHRLCLQRVWQRAVRMELHRLQRRHHRLLLGQPEWNEHVQFMRNAVGRYCAYFLRDV